MNTPMTTWKACYVLSLFIAATACDIPEDEGASDMSEGFAEETLAESTQDAEFRISEPQLAQAEFESGWPGTRGYVWRVGDGRPVVQGQVFVFNKTLYGAGTQSFAWKMDGNFIEISVTMPEGDAFNPNKHGASISVIYFYL
jgi:hypothetical protein